MSLFTNRLALAAEQCKRTCIVYSIPIGQLPQSRQNRSIRHSTGYYPWASGKMFCTPSSLVHANFTFMAKKVPEQMCYVRPVLCINPRTVIVSALLLRMQKNRCKFYNNSAIQSGVRVRLFSAATSLVFSALRIHHNQITSQFECFA